MGYEYTDKERILIAFFTGTTNFAFIPLVYLLKLQKRYFEVYLAIYTFVTSFFYHVCEGLDYDIYMNQKKWHICDNIGSITAMNTILVYFMGLKSYEAELKYNIISLFLIITFQIDEPWDLNNTIFPILIFVVILLYHVFFIGIEYKINKEMLQRGLLLFSIAVFFFYFGLDEHTDYLRIVHSWWHIFIAWSTFYLRQAVIVLHTDDHRTFEYGDIYKDIITLNFSKLAIADTKNNGSRVNSEKEIKYKKSNKSN